MFFLCFEQATLVLSSHGSHLKTVQCHLYIYSSPKKKLTGRRNIFLELINTYRYRRRARQEFIKLTATGCYCLKQ